MSQNEMLEDLLNNFLKLIIASEILNVDIDYKLIEKLTIDFNDVITELSKKIIRRKFTGDKSRKLNEEIDNIYTKLQSVKSDLNIQLLYTKKIKNVSLSSDFDLAWKELEDLENYLTKKEEEKVEILSPIIYTITELKRALIDYLSSVSSDTSEAFLIIRGDEFMIVLGDKLYQLRINGLTIDERNSMDSIRLQKALDLLLGEENRIKNQEILGEIFNISKIKEGNKVVNVMISFAEAKKILDIKKAIGNKVRLVKKVEDLCFFISEAEKESVYLMTPCNFELKNNEEYIYDGEKFIQP
ncbi:MAG: hypothetical protein QXR34_03705 [Saccharolobus sp.]